MREWKISEAKARFSEVVGACEEAPQVLYNRGKPVAALVAMADYEALLKFKQKIRQPEMTELLDELESINCEEGDFGEPPLRSNRNTSDLG